MRLRDKILIVLACACFLGVCLYFAPEVWPGGDQLYHELVLPIFLGYLSTYFFYLITIYLPEKKRYTQIRLKIEQQQYYIYTRLFSLIDSLFFIHNNGYQEKIRAGMLDFNDFDIALQNKCLSKLFLYDEYAREYVVVGNRLKSFSEEIDAEINRVYTFHSYLSEEEIILLGEIRTKLFTYDFDGNACFIINREQYVPACPNIAYMSRNYYISISCF